MASNNTQTGNKTMTITKNQIVTLKNGKQYKVVRITANHVDLQEAKYSHLPTIATGYTSYPRSKKSIQSIWNALQR